MKKIIIILIPFIFLCLSVCGIPQTYTWEKIYNGSGTQNDYAKCNSDIYNDSYYYVGGRTGLVCYILKINCKTGAKIWEKTIGHSSEQGIVDAIILTEDGGCVFSGSRGNAFSVKLDSLGEVVWNKFYDVKDANLKKIIRLSDGNFLMCGYTGFQGLVIKIDAIGNFIWSRKHNFSQASVYSSAVEVKQKYYLTGSTRIIQDTSNVIFISLDSGGTMSSSKIYKFFNMDCLGGNITYKSDNFFLTGESSGAFFLVKINFVGDILYQKRITYTRYDGYTHSKFINNNFYFSSILISNNNDSLYGKILITDSLGNEIKHKLFRKYDLEIRDFTTSTKDNLIITGTISNNGATDDDYYLLRVDSTLNVSIKTNSVLVKDFQLHQNYPNPFNPSTKISYSLKKSSAIELNLFDINGRLIKIIESGFKPAGSYEINFSAEGLSSGVYFFSLYSEGILMDTKKAVVMK